ncbi:MAG: PAS domain-containing sensor histidine kinase [Gemmatimonadetes bacterium]|nr:MAG: PAS domain-containing sensor histidine kinase [Gemmatimonadota bacterium]
MANLLLLITEALVLGGVALVLHAFERRYGLAPLLFYVAALTVSLHSMGAVPVFIDGLGLRFMFDSTTLVPAIMMAFLVVYARDGTAAARTTVLGIVGASIVALLLQYARLAHLLLPGGSTVSGLDASNPIFARSVPMTLSALAGFVAALSASAIAYQAVARRQPARLGPWAPALVALVTGAVLDTIVFAAVLDLADERVVPVAQMVLTKCVSAALLGLMAAAYLSRRGVDGAAHAGAAAATGRASGVGPATPDTGGPYDPRRTLDLVLGSYGRQARELERARHAHERSLQALRAAQARLQALLARAELVVFGLDADGRFTLSEGAGLTALGLDPGEVVGRSALDLFPQAADDIRRALAGERLTATVQVGDTVWETLYTPLLDEGGRVEGVFGVSANVTERIAAEAALAESEARFRNTFEQAGVGIAHVSLDGRFVRVNSKLCEITGRTAEELLGLTFEDITHPDDVERSRAAAELLVSGRLDTHRDEKRYVRPDGSSVWVELTVAVARDGDGRPDYFISVTEDITERRETELKLRQALKMEAVGQLTGGVAHDFNNLLTVIIGGLDAALAGPPGQAADVDRSLRLALDAAEKASGLTRRLLAFSRRQSLQPTRIEVGEVLDGMHELLARTLTERVRLRVDAPDDLWPCVADVTQLENAVLNLAINARDAMPDGGELSISAANAVIGEDDCDGGDARPGEYVALTVADTGSGMDAETAARAFEPFFSTKEVGKGSGLGLPMVYGFVRQSDGFLRLMSEPGEGTRITLYLPRAGADTRAARPRAERSGGETFRGSGERVLVVEDDPQVRNLTVEIVRSLGYDVAEAGDAEEALAVLADLDRVDLLFTDVILPGPRSGTDLAEEVQRRWPGLPILFTSGYSADHFDTHTPAPGTFVDLVPKPFRRGELAERLRAALDRAADGGGGSGRG